MTLQEPHNTEDAQGAFKSSSPSQSEMINLAERNATKEISKSKSPIIIITEDKATSYGNLYKRLNDALPNIPVVFENKSAQQKFELAQFCMAHEFKHRVVGHFVHTDDFQANGLCTEIKKSDCVIVFGEPQTDLTSVLDTHGDYITGDKINLSLLDSMKRKKDDWKTWNKHLQQRPSI